MDLAQDVETATVEKVILLPCKDNIGYDRRPFAITISLFYSHPSICSKKEM